jgi:hypothetical protein
VLLPGECFPTGQLALCHIPFCSPPPTTPVRRELALATSSAMTQLLLRGRTRDGKVANRNVR